jgi:tripartite-type tricarboxylate transporter receptor subunit TctC
VSSGFKATKLSELIALARERPGQLNFGSGGVGTSLHLAGEYLKARAGIELVHVPYKGAAPAIAAMQGNEIQMLFDNGLSAIGHIRSGRTRGLGIASASRSPVLPDVPTFEESGLAGFDVTSWVGIFAPAKTPGPVIERLYKELALVLRTPFVKERYGVLGIEPVGNPPREFFEQVRDDLARWRKVVKAANIKVE